MSSERIYSFSQINTYVLCPERYKFSYIEKIYQKDESIEAFMGNRIHEVLDWVFTERKNKFTTFDKLAEKFDELWLNSWHEKIFIADPRINANHFYTIGLRCLGNFCNMYGPMFTNPTVGTEIKLNFEIENYKFRGVIDRLDKTEDNTLIVTDYKTSKKAKGSIAAKSDLQLGLYHLAIQQNFSIKNKVLIGWNFLRQNKKVYHEHNEKSLKKIKTKVVRTVEEIEDTLIGKQIFLPKESILCHWCYFWDKCSVKDSINPARLAK